MIKHKLQNGLTVLLTPQKETKAVTTLVLVGVGSRYESNSIAGMAHFLEHMMFKGTKKRKNTLALSRELDKIGADYNAFTGKDHTGYYIKANAEHLNLSLDMLSDMLNNSKLEQQEIDREKGTIIEEINMYEDHPSDDVDEELYQIIYKKNPISKKIVGTKKTVSEIDNKKMLSFRNKYYSPENMVLSLAGNFKTEKAKKIIEKYFGQEKVQKPKPEFKKVQKNQNKPQIKIKHKKAEQVHLALGLWGPKYSDKDLIATQLLSNILGGNMSSRLFINIRERHGLCYYIKSGLNIYQDTGNLMIRAGLDKKRIHQALELILDELRKIKKQGITNAELKNAKENMKGKIILHLEDSEAIASWYGNQELLNKKTETQEEKITKIMKVKKVDVEKVAKKIFQTSKLNLAMVGSIKNEKEFLKILKI